MLRKKMNLQVILQKIGLEEKEAKVYLALLGLGETTATKLAEATSIDRTLMYQITNKLIEKGLISYVIKEHIRYFSAADPDFLVRDLKEKEEELKSILPELKAKKNSLKQNTSAEIYKGRKGVYSLLKFIVSQNKTYYCIGGMGEVCTKFETEAAAVVHDAQNSKTPGKILARKEDNLFIGSNEELRFLPSHLLSSTSLMMVGNTTVVFIWSEPYHAIVINNPSFTKDNLLTFNYLWNIAKKPTKKEISERLLKG